MKIYPSAQEATQADGVSALEIIGEVHEVLLRNKATVIFDALVCKRLNGTDILGGMNFLYDNSIVPDARKQTITVGKFVFPETNYLNVSKALAVMSLNMSQLSTYPQILSPLTISNKAERILFPGESLTFQLPPNQPHNHLYAVQPVVNLVNALPGISPDKTSWPTVRTIMAKGDKLYVTNDTDTPIHLPKTPHLATARPLLATPTNNQPNTEKLENLLQVMKEKVKPEDYLSKISVDPHNVHTKEQKDKVWEILRKYHTVFDGDISEGYNSASGPSIADFNFQEDNPLMENKGYFPRYSHDEEMILQGICDYYEDMGILQDPLALNIPIKHVSPLLLVQKPHTQATDKEKLTIKDFRVVGAFNALNDKIKAIPIPRPEPEHVHMFASKCKYLFKTDADTYFYQLWADQSKWPYLIVQTPFKGKKILTRAVMGVKGMSECADAHMAKILQDLIINETAVQDHDDIVTGSSDFEESLLNLEALLETCFLNNVKLSPHKTICLPQKVDITGWEWSNNGSVSPSSHQIIKLKNITKESIVTVKNMRSFVGLYKVFFKAHPNQAVILAKLEASCAGAESKKHIVWSPELEKSFLQAIDDIENIRPRWLPKPSDQLVVTQDAALKDQAIGLILWAIRDNQWYLVEAYSTILNGSLENWFPCELEGFAIGTSGKKFKHFITRSNHETVFLSDSSSWRKMKTGKMSASSRLCLFLSSVSSLPIRLEHSSGKLGQIIGSDAISRNANICSNPLACQMCKYIKDAMNDTPVDIRKVNVEDIIQGRVSIPFLSRQAIKDMQQECSSCVKAIEYIRNGVTPQANNRKITDTKRYVRDCKVDKDNLLYAERTAPDLKTKKVPVIPKHLGKALIFAQHIALNHIRKSQMKIFIDRNMYLLQSAKILKEALKNCHLCIAADNLIKDPPIFSSETIPKHPGSNFVADVMKHSKQDVLVAVDDATGYVLTTFVKSEQAADLAQGIAKLVLPLRIGPHAIIRVDQARGLAKAGKSPMLQKMGIQFDLGDSKNKNSCAIVDKAIQELEMELKRLNPENTKLNELTLLLGTHHLNSKLRPSKNNLSSKEMLLLRDQFTGSQLDINDSEAITAQHKRRLKSHPTEVKSVKTPSSFQAGDLVLLKGEGNKHQVRDTYVVCGPGPSSRPNTIKIRKMLHMLDTTVPGKIMKQLYLVKPSQLIKYLAACSNLSESESTESSESENEELPISRTPDKTSVPDKSDQIKDIAATLIYSSDDDLTVIKRKRKVEHLTNPTQEETNNQENVYNCEEHPPDNHLFSTPEHAKDEMVPLFQADNHDQIIDASPPSNHQVLSESSDVSINFGYLQLSSPEHQAEVIKIQT